MIALYATAYAATAVVFLGLDFLWLSTMAGSFYKSRIGAMLLDEPNIGAAALFYLVYVAGIVHFAVMPAVTAGNWVAALMSGAFLGLIAYGTYDITNLATLRNWPIAVAAVDLGWGVALTGFAALCGFGATMLVFGRF
ncbi:MAG: DUF2177 family protein [Alphaproteobacteria bacterium]|nr:DUF2177 family protein [Alphaproteobacteria bacterium]